MRKHIYGRLWGVIQLGFWIIMIPWILISIPLDLWYETSQHSNYFSDFFLSPWVDWKIGVIVLSTSNILLVCISIIWMGWHKIHPLTTAKAESLSQTNLDRLQAVQKFSKEAYLNQLRKEAHQYRILREKKRLKMRKIIQFFKRK
ncbi:MAG: hypothetical protein K9W44_18540 [Candidatus Lokiarchaeota archaeon]|nr:hypothetical protein [Candidatus Harpocratesius repetitus]